MNYEHLDRKIVTSWRIARLIRFAVTVAVLGLPTLILSRQEYFAPIGSYVYPVEGLIFIYLMAAPFLYPAIEYRQWGYMISKDRVEIRHGIFFVETTIIPVVRIQHITVSQGPILRKLSLSNVIIHTASGAFTIEGLSNENARAIAEALKAKLDTRLEAQDKVGDGYGI